MQSVIRCTIIQDQGLSASILAGGANYRATVPHRRKVLEMSRQTELALVIDGNLISTVGL